MSNSNSLTNPKTKAFNDASTAVCEIRDSLAFLAVAMRGILESEAQLDRYELGGFDSTMQNLSRLADNAIEALDQLWDLRKEANE